MDTTSQSRRFGRSINNIFQRVQRSVRFRLHLTRSIVGNNTIDTNTVAATRAAATSPIQAFPLASASAFVPPTSDQDTSAAWQPFAIGTFVMSSTRNTRPATGQLRRAHDGSDAQPPRRSRRVAGEAPESTGLNSPLPRRPQPVQPQSSLYRPPPSSDFTFTRADPPVPPPGFASAIQSVMPAAPTTDLAPRSLDASLGRQPRHVPRNETHVPRQPTLEGILSAPGQSRDQQTQEVPIKVEEDAVPKDKPVRKVCDICCESDGAAVLQPCRMCTALYCQDCIRTMFLEATHNSTSMPPRCCTILPTTIAVACLSTSELDEYRLKFEEWVSSNKTYCPVPKCSKFIPDRAVISPPARPIADLWGLLRQELPHILKTLEKAHCARFFRGPMDPATHGVPNFTKLAKKPIVWLNDLSTRLPRYADFEEFTSDFNRIIANTRYLSYNHPMVISGEELRKRFWQEISKIKIKPNASLSKLPAGACFSCPECHIAICPSCKQIAHFGKACDTTAQDHEMAMLQTYGYKKCPRCGHGVKRMFGCRHMQCRCGAHWCWGCLSSIEDCDGSCSPYTDGSDDEYDDDDDIDPPIAAEARPEGAQPTVPGQFVGRPAGQSTRTTTSIPQDENSPDAQPAPLARGTVNLDAGGLRVWGNTGANFGDEPNDGHHDPIWSCPHKFEHAHLSKNVVKRGVPLEMECFRCFSRTRASIHKSDLTPSNIKTEENEKQDIQGYKPPREKEKAWQCNFCDMLVCTECKEQVSWERGM